jgi:hypothetical protein
VRQNVRCHGSHQPRSYYLKARGEDDLVRYLEIPVRRINPVDRIIAEMRDAARRTQELLDRIKRDM